MHIKMTQLRSDHFLTGREQSAFRNIQCVRKLRSTHERSFARKLLINIKQWDTAIRLLPKATFSTYAKLNVADRVQWSERSSSHQSGDTLKSATWCERGEISVILTPRRQRRILGIRSPAVPARHRLLYDARESCYANAGIAIGYRIPQGDLKRHGGVRIADIVNTPVKPRVCESRMRRASGAQRGFAPLISRCRRGKGPRRYFDTSAVTSLRHLCTRIHRPCKLGIDMPRRWVGNASQVIRADLYNLSSRRSSYPFVRSKSRYIWVIKRRHRCRWAQLSSGADAHGLWRLILEMLERFGDARHCRANAGT